MGFHFILHFNLRVAQKESFFFVYLYINPAELVKSVCKKWTALEQRSECNLPQVNKMRE